MMRKPLLILLFITVIVFATTHAEKKVTIELDCFPAWDVVYKELLHPFNKEHPDIRVKIVSHGYGDHHQGLQSRIEQGVNVPDLAIVEIGYLPRFIAKGLLEDLSQEPYSAGRYRESIAPYKWVQGSTNSGAILAFPVEVTPGCVYWRRDIFERSGVKIEDIRTMDDLFNAAGKIVRDSDGDSRIDRFFTSRASDIAVMILNSAQTSLAEMDAEGNWKIDVQRIREAYRWARKFKEFGYTAEVSAWSNGWYKAFQDGATAYEISGSWLGGHLQSWIAPNTKRNWGVAKWPALYSGQIPMAGNWGGSFLAIPKNAVHKEEAWAFIEYACTNKQAQITAFKKADAFPSFMEAWNDPAFDEPLDFYAGQNTRRLWAEIARSIPLVYSHTYDEEVQRFVSIGIYKVLDENQDPDSIAEWVEKNIREIKPRK